MFDTLPSIKNCNLAGEDYPDMSLEFKKYNNKGMTVEVDEIVNYIGRRHKAICRHSSVDCMTQF